MTKLFLNTNIIFYKFSLFHRRVALGETCLWLPPLQREFNVRLIWVMFHIWIYTDKGKIVWVPSHQGIRGNELADKETNEGKTSITYHTHQLPTTTADFNKAIKNHITNDWYTRWSSRQSHLHKFRNNVIESRPNTQRREDQFYVTRLRIGHTPLS